MGLHLAEDESLMERVRDFDDRMAFEELVKRHQKKILNFFYRCCVQYDKEDLVQQTFLRLYHYRLKYKKSAKLTTFLFLLARQVWIDELRKRKRIERLKSQFTKDSAKSSKSQNSASDARFDVGSALAKLSDDMRMVVELGVYQGLAYREIAEILKIPEGTVKSRMFNALRKLRAILEKK
ncbi:MAG: RNA polymerase sigma factor [Kiritimatiellae bacterium]|nr:RNA polymerase sigma factor [Kiritimatiellia bacterium]